MTSKTSLLGAAGEHYVLCQLLRRDFIAALAPQGVPNADIIVTDDIGQRLCAVQVKTRRELGSDGGWHMSKKHEGIISDRLFYCFVDFGESLNAQPECYIIPSAIVAQVLQESHQLWLALPGKRGQKHNDTDMRRLTPDYSQRIPGCAYGRGWLDEYRQAWQLMSA